MKTAGILIVAVLAFTQRTECATRLDIKPPVIALGELYYGTSVESKVRILNAGDESLRIIAVRTSCPSCSVTALPQDTIPPSTEEVLTITYLAKGAVGTQRAMVYIHSSDRAEPVKTITITATIVSPEGAPKLIHNSSKLDVGVIAVGQAHVAKLAVGNAQDAKTPLVIHGCMASRGCTVVKPVPKEIVPGQKQALSLEISAREPGVVREWVNIETNDPITPIVNVPIEGYAVKEASQAAPTQQNGLFLQLIGDAVAVPGTGGKFRQELLILNQTPGQVKVKFPQASGSLAKGKPAALTLKPGEPEIVDLELDPEQVGKSESVRIEIEYPVVEK